MRKKRRLAGEAVRDAEIERELTETPEIQEAIEGAELARDAELEAKDEARAALLAAMAAAPGVERVDADADEALEAGAANDGDEASDGEASAETPATMSPARLASLVESLLFAAEKPLGLKDLRSLTRVRELPLLEAAVEAVRARHEGHGIVLHEVAGGFQFRTASVNSAWVQQLIAGRPVRLSRAQLETLAIIAYRQPITRPEIDEIRGVDSGSTLKVLMDRDLIRVLGKKEEPGRPLIYGTTREFLEFFHLKDLRELPTLREFHELSEDSLREVEQMDRSEARARKVAEEIDAPIETDAETLAAGGIAVIDATELDDPDSAVASEDLN
jgi:segregation and condensation protein B